MNANAKSISSINYTNKGTTSPEGHSYTHRMVHTDDIKEKIREWKESFL